MFGNVAVYHPPPRICKVYEQIRLGSNREEHRVFPDEVLASDAVAGEYEKTLAVEMKWVLHGVKGVSVVVHANLHDVPAAKAPVNIHVLATACRIT